MAGRNDTPLARARDELFSHIHQCGVLEATDDQGRYVVPDLPKANYDIWVRGYWLVDSPKMRASPGRLLNHTAVPA